MPPTLPRTRTLLTVHDLSFVRDPESAVPVLRAYLNKVVPRSVARADQAERAQKSLEAAIDAAKTDAQKARDEAARAKAAAESKDKQLIAAATGAPAATEGGSGSGEIAARAREVYEAINDILSEMRNNVVIVQDELPKLRAADKDTMRAVTDAIDALVEGAETAKGALRSLRELAESH